MLKSLSNLALILTLCPFIFQQQQRHQYGMALETLPSDRAAHSPLKPRFSQPAPVPIQRARPLEARPGTRQSPQPSGGLAGPSNSSSLRSQSSIEYKSNFTNYLSAPQPQPQPSARPVRQKKAAEKDQWPRAASKKPSEVFKSSIVQRDLSHKFQHFTPTSNHLGRPLFEPVQLQVQLQPLTQTQQQPAPRFQPTDILSNFSRSLVLGFNRPNFLQNISRASHFFNGSSAPGKLAVAAGSGMANSISRTQPVKLGGAATLFELGAALSGGLANERLGSIVRTGPILSHPLVGSPFAAPLPAAAHLRALMPSSLALFAHHQEDQHSRATNHLRPLHAGLHRHQRQRHLLEAQPTALPSAGLDFGSAPAPTAKASPAPFADQMIATANQLGVTHMNPQSLNGISASESNSYNSIASLQDYPDRSSGHHHSGNEQPPAAHMDPNHAPMGQGSMAQDEQRGGGGAGGGPFNDYQSTEQSHYEPTSSSKSAGNQGGQRSNDLSSNSRSSPADGYSLRAEHKGPPGANSLRTTIDSFEDMAGLPTSEYERDLADLDEEFSRQSYRRPSGPLMSDSFLAPERYERRYRRPSYDYSADFLSTAGSMSSIVPRSYQRSPISWSSSGQYADGADLWSDSSVDFSPLSSYVSPNHYTTYRWRPRYQRVSPYSSQHYLAPSASEQQLQPAYNIVPSYSSPPPPPPTETISIALSPLAAAAAAAASALAAADKSRGHSHGWLTLPRITTTSSMTTPSSTAASSSQHAAATLPAGALQAAYIHRPGPYALGSVPIYAIAPRPTIATAAAAQGPASASYIPYFHGGAPTIIAYRPTGVMPSGSLLTSASFAYPLRLPVVPPPAHYGHLSASGTRANAQRPFYSDLQYAETKPKTNLNNNNSNGGSDSKIKVTSLSAMAKNLTKKMFGSASQIRPQHVSPPAEFSLLTSSQNSSSAGSS